MYTYNINLHCTQLVEASAVYVRVMPQTQTLCIWPWRTEVDSSCLFKSKKHKTQLQIHNALFKHISPAGLKTVFFQHSTNLISSLCFIHIVLYILYYSLDRNILFNAILHRQQYLYCTMQDIYLRL